MLNPKHEHRGLPAPSSVETGPSRQGFRNSNFGFKGSRNGISMWDRWTSKCRKIDDL
jgi:hypothetical protein